MDSAVASHGMEPMSIDLDSLQDTLDEWAYDEVTPALLQHRLQILNQRGLDRLPLPGQGQTLERWRALAQVAHHALGLVKLYEGHTDALAILSELDGYAPPESLWGVWAAEPPDARLLVRYSADGMVTLHGRKSWCSGASLVSHALVTAWMDDHPMLVAVEMKQPGVEVTQDGWRAIGMQHTGSVDVLFDGAAGVLVGAPGRYLHRPGFWHGGGGIAACWYGSATALADTLRAHCKRHREPHALAHLGHVDAALLGAATALRQAAEWLDLNPEADARYPVCQLRALVEQCAEIVIRHTGRAFGAAPLCRDAYCARHMADLPVYLRQSHAERDLAVLGDLNLLEGAPWQL